MKKCGKIEVIPFDKIVYKWAVTFVMQRILHKPNKYVNPYGKLTT